MHKHVKQRALDAYKATIKCILQRAKIRIKYYNVTKVCITTC